MRLRSLVSLLNRTAFGVQSTSRSPASRVRQRCICCAERLFLDANSAGSTGVPSRAIEMSRSLSCGSILPLSSSLRTGLFIRRLQTSQYVVSRDFYSGMSQNKARRLDWGFFGWFPAPHSAGGPLGHYGHFGRCSGFSLTEDCMQLFYGFPCPMCPMCPFGFGTFEPFGTRFSGQSLCGFSVRLRCFPCPTCLQLG